MEEAVVEQIKCPGKQTITKLTRISKEMRLKKEKSHATCVVVVHRSNVIQSSTTQTLIIRSKIQVQITNTKVIESQKCSKLKTKDVNQHKTRAKE